MTSPIRDLIFQGLEQLLSAMDGIDGLTVEINRRAPVTPEECPILIVLNRGSQSINTEANELKVYDATVTIEGYVAAVADADLGPSINDLYARTIERIEADPTLAATALNTWEQECDFEVDTVAGHEGLASFTLQLRVMYQTARIDPYVAPS